MEESTNGTEESTDRTEESTNGTEESADRTGVPVEPAMPAARAYRLAPSDKSYLYTRLSVLVVVVALAVSIALSRYRSGVVLDSISAYYYTPVHALFIGSLVALGVVMIALRSSDDLEDMVLNVAGAVALIVAFVPTTPPALVDPPVVVDSDLLIRNNVVSMLVAMVLALVVAFVLAVRSDQSSAVLLRSSAVLPRSRASVVGLTLSGVLLASLIGWYVFARDEFLQHAHDVSATVMFVLIIAAVLVNADWPAGLISALRRWLDINTVPVSPQRRWYLAIAGWMVFGGALAVAIGGASRVFWLEVVEIAGFVAFWTTQTIAPPPSSPLCHR